jgi:lipopolysaccharide/colanic/teichoic acid biosynthesis glycosyltransferase
MRLVLFPSGVPLIKRLFDLLVSALVGILLIPFILIIALIILVVDGWPVFFVQDRPGLSGKVFKNFKFRTMREMKDSQGKLLPEEQRLFGFGRFLRRFSLDEIPEIFNVLCGEMSLVGPRPLLVEYLPYYSAEQSRRHEVLPGITGWAQVNGRNILSWEDRFQLDVWYVDHWSFGLDLKIIFMTIWKVLSGEGISPPEMEIMPKFSGKPGK